MAEYRIGTAPDYSTILPNYFHCLDFKGRIKRRPLWYAEGRDRWPEITRTIQTTIEWNQVYDLFHFVHEQRLGDILSLACLRREMHRQFRPFLVDPSKAKFASVLLFHDIPELVNDFAGSPGLGDQMPVFDRTQGKYGKWLPPHQPKSGWDGKAFKRQVAYEFTAAEFCTNAAEILRSEEYAKRMAVILRGPTEGHRPNDLLRILVDQIWESMERVAGELRISTERPEKPSLSLHGMELFDVAYDRMGIWIDRVNAADRIGAEFRMAREILEWAGLCPYQPNHQIPIADRRARVTNELLDLAVAAGELKKYPCRMGISLNHMAYDPDASLGAAREWILNASAWHALIDGEPLQLPEAVPTEEAFRDELDRLAEWCRRVAGKCEADAKSLIDAGLSRSTIVPATAIEVLAKPEDDRLKKHGNSDKQTDDAVDVRFWMEHFKGKGLKLMMLLNSGKLIDESTIRTELHYPQKCSEGDALLALVKRNNAKLAELHNILGRGKTISHTKRHDRHFLQLKDIH